MEEHSFLQSSVIFLLAAALAVPLFMRLGLSAVLGYLAAGALIGPAGLGLIASSENTLAISELGIVLLLFLIGLELSPARVWLMRRAVFGVGTAQVALAATLITAAALIIDAGWQAAVVAGLGLALSSTAIGTQILSERRELMQPHGRLSFAVLLFQDIVTLPIIALVPLLALHGLPVEDAPSVWLAAARIVGVLVAVIVIGRFLVRPLFAAAARTNSSEAFAAAALLVVFGTAWLMEQVGLSPALGAFLAGVLLAESEYRRELETDLEPFKGLLLGLFFISVGMAVELPLILNEPLYVAALTFGVIVLKLAVLWPVGRLGGLDGRDSLKMAALLCQGGEFGFVIFAVAAQNEVISAETRSLLVVVVALSMALTPVLVALIDRLLARRVAPGEAPQFDTIEDGHPRVIIAGFGRIGQIVARMLRAQKIPFIALEHSPEQVEVSRRFGSTLYYGDPSRPALLHAAHADRAEIFVAATDDPEQILRMVRLVRRRYPHLKVLARARNRQHAFRLMDLGVDLVVRETFHSALELSRATLTSLGLSEQEAEDRIARFRTHDEALLREQHLLYDDDAALMQSNRDALRELEKLFEADR